MQIFLCWYWGKCVGDDDFENMKTFYVQDHFWVKQVDLRKSGIRTCAPTKLFKFELNLAKVAR